MLSSEDKINIIQEYFSQGYKGSIGDVINKIEVEQQNTLIEGQQGNISSEMTSPTFPANTPTPSSVDFSTPNPTGNLVQSYESTSPGIQNFRMGEGESAVSGNLAQYPHGGFHREANPGFRETPQYYDEGLSFTHPQSMSYRASQDWSKVKPILDEHNLTMENAKQYVSSDNFYNLSKKQGYSDAEIQLRRNAILNFDASQQVQFNPFIGNSWVEPGDPNLVTYGMYDRGASWKKGNTDWYWPNVVEHEIGHLGYGTGTSSQSIPLKPGEYGEISQRIKESGISRTSYDHTTHDISPYERRADLFQLRMQLMKSNIYDSSEGGEFTKEHLDEFKKTDEYNRMFRLHDDDNIIWMMNNIAKEQEHVPLRYSGSEYQEVKTGGLRKYQNGGIDFDWEPDINYTNPKQPLTFNTALPPNPVPFSLEHPDIYNPKDISTTDYDFSYTRGSDESSQGILNRDLSSINWNQFYQSINKQEHFSSYNPAEDNIFEHGKSFTLRPGETDWIRTKHRPVGGSTAFGPSQITRTLLLDATTEGAQKWLDMENIDLDFVNKLLKQADLYNYYGNNPDIEGYNPLFDYGGAGIIEDNPVNREKYKQLSIQLMQGLYRKGMSNNPNYTIADLASDWKGTGNLDEYSSNVTSYYNRLKQLETTREGQGPGVNFDFFGGEITGYKPGFLDKGISEGGPLELQRSNPHIPFRFNKGGYRKNYAPKFCYDTGGFDKMDPKWKKTLKYMYKNFPKGPSLLWKLFMAPNKLDAPPLYNFDELSIPPQEEDSILNLQNPTKTYFESEKFQYPHGGFHIFKPGKMMETGKEQLGLEGNQPLTDKQKENIELGLAFGPGTGELIDAKNTIQSLKEGNYGDAALHAAGFAFPFLPGKALVKGKKWLFDKVKKGEKPTVEPPIKPKPKEIPTPEWSTGVSHYGHYSHAAAGDALSGLRQTGKYLDDIKFDASTLSGKNTFFHGSRGGRSLVEVRLPGGQTQMFYKSTSKHKNAWMPYGGEMTKTYPPGHKKAGQTYEWFAKGDANDIENFYNSQSYRDIGGQLDIIAIEEGWDMSKQKLIK